MKLLRNIVIILVVILIFVFFFAGKGIFDDFLPITQIKNSVIIALGKEKLVDMGKYGVIVAKDGDDVFLEYMLGEGYQLSDISDDSMTFVKKDGDKVTYTPKDFLFGKIYMPVTDSLSKSIASTAPLLQQ